MQYLRVVVATCNVSKGTTRTGRNIISLFDSLTSSSSTSSCILSHHHTHQQQRSFCSKLMTSNNTDNVQGLVHDYSFNSLNIQQYSIQPKEIQFRTFTTIKQKSSNNNRNNANDDDDDDDYQVLYQRDLSRNRMPRILLNFSVINTTYWIWYVLDFIPAINSSSATELHVDPTVGIVGVAIGIGMTSMMILYPILSISQLSFSYKKLQWKVWKHDLPFISMSKYPIEYKLGTLTIDPSSADVKTIIQQHNGNIRDFQGHVGITVKGHQLPLLMEIQSPKNVPGSDTTSTSTKTGFSINDDMNHSDLLFQALVNPKSIERNVMEFIDGTSTNNTNKKRNNKKKKQHPKRRR